MNTLKDRIKLAQTQEVHTVVNVETGGWLGEYETFDGSDEYGHRRFSLLHCDIKSPLDCTVFDSKNEAQKVANLPYSSTDKVKYIVVTLTLPT